MDLPYLKTISQIFYQLQKSRYIAEITSLVQVVIWYEYLVKFSPLIFADHCRYHRFWVQDIVH